MSHHQVAASSALAHLVADSRPTESYTALQAPQVHVSIAPSSSAGTEFVVGTVSTSASLDSAGVGSGEPLLDRAFTLMSASHAAAIPTTAIGSYTSDTGDHGMAHFLADPQPASHPMALGLDHGYMSLHEAHGLHGLGAQDMGPYSPVHAEPRGSASHGDVIVIHDDPEIAASQQQMHNLQMHGHSHGHF